MWLLCCIGREREREREWVGGREAERKSLWHSEFWYGTGKQYALVRLKNNAYLMDWWRHRVKQVS